jgi:hypothetical protein
MAASAARMQPVTLVGGQEGKHIIEKGQLRRAGIKNANVVKSQNFCKNRTA